MTPDREIFQELSGAELFSQFGPSDAPVIPESTVVPQFAIVRPGRLRQFTSSLRVLLGGPASPKQFLGGDYFRDCWIEPRFPKFAFVIAIICQLLIVRFPPPVWKLQPPRSETIMEHTQLTWYGPIKDFPAMLPARRKPEIAPAKGIVKSKAEPGADAFHPRQTIISAPVHPTHPRQTLVQPAAPLEPPKILPALPNIVELANARPARPELQLSAEQILAMRPKAPQVRATQDAAAPQIAMPDKTLGSIDIATSERSPAKPVLHVAPMSAPREAARVQGSNVAAPEISSGNSNRTLIALSATPAPVAPPVSAPNGNLSARVVISPEGRQPGTPAGNSGGGSTGAGEAGEGGGRGPEGIFISRGNANTGSNSELGIGSAMRGIGSAYPSRPVPRIGPAASIPPAVAESGPAHAGPKLGLAPDAVLGSKRVYTLHVNMPNLTSASGSWVLNFAELNDMDAALYEKPGGGQLAAPVPLRKVDPKYPPELRTGHVEGEVILYAVIRKDGSVDSIQLVHSVDPSLDSNAMQALAQWKFRPAEKGGEPVDLEAVVHIPFRSRAPQL